MKKLVQKRRQFLRQCVRTLAAAAVGSLVFANLAQASGDPEK